jgi:small conductance mechanosensitive channel
MRGNTKPTRSAAVAVLIFAACAASGTAAYANDAALAASAVSAHPQGPEPVTTKDPQVTLDDLELLLAPMTKDEIEVEAKGWFDLVRAKERQITAAELDVHRKNREITLLEKQKVAATELAKTSQEVTTAGGAGAGSAKDNAAAAERLEEAQKKLVKTVETASKESAKEDKKAEAATAAMAKQAEASPPPPAATDNEATQAAAAAKVAVAAPATNDKETLQNTVEAAAKKSETTGDEKAREKVEKVVAATEKEAAATEQMKSLAQAAPAAAGATVAATTAAPTAANETAKDTSQKAETLAKKAEDVTAAKTDVKVQLVDYSTQLMTERTALVDRLKLVLDKWEAKGGDPKTYRLYVASIGGIKIDVSDQAATWTRISTWLTADEGGLRWARSLATFLGYVLGSVVVAWIVRTILSRVMNRGHMTSQLLRDFVLASSGRVVVASGFLLGLSALEINLTPLLEVIGAAGFVAAFAFQGTLSNFASGLLIMIFKPFDVADEVEVGSGIKGKVTHLTNFSTYIRTDDGLQKIVPNDIIWKNVIINETAGTVKSPAAAESKPAAR